MNSKMHSALAAWTLFSLLNRSEEHADWVDETGLGLEKQYFTLVPGYNQTNVGQQFKIELDEIVNGRFMWKLMVPASIKIVKDLVQEDNKHIWLIQATQPGRYKIVADYIDKKRMTRIRKRILFEVEAVPCQGREKSDKKQNTTK